MKARDELPWLMRACSGWRWSHGFCISHPSRPRGGDAKARHSQAEVSHMCVYVYACMYVCTWVSVFACVCVCTYVCTCAMYTYINACMLLHMFSQTRTRSLRVKLSSVKVAAVKMSQSAKGICMYVCVYVYIHQASPGVESAYYHTCARMHTYIHAIYTHAHIHTCDLYAYIHAYIHAIYTIRTCSQGAERM
jgi:hypothetical protein